jgi:Tfp pilus assembly protein PilF
LERAIESDPERPDAHYSLGRALAARGEDELAMKHFLAAVEGAPEQVAIHLEIAKIYESHGDLDAARHHIQLARNGGAIPSQALPKESTVPSKTP